MILSLAAVAALAAAPAGAIEKVDNAAGDTVTATTTTANGRASITLKNDPDVDAEVTVGTEFRHDTTEVTVKAEWIKYPHAAEPSGVFKLKAGETATFEVSGEFARPGVYETFIEVSGKTGRLRYPVRITRTIKAIDAAFLLEPKLVHIGLTFPDIATSSPYLVRLTGRNASGDTVEVDAPLVGQMLTGSTDAKTQAATSEAPVVVGNGCAGEVLAGQSCVFDVELPRGLSPGSYWVDVLLPGRGGGQSARTVSVDIRASAWLAGIVVALGVALGALVTDWRTTGRPTVNRRIDLARLREDAQKLAQETGQLSVGRRARQLVLELKALDIEIVAGKEASTKPDDYQQRLTLLTRANALLETAAQAKGEAAKTFIPLTQQLSAALDSTEWKGETITAAADKLSFELSGFQSLFDAAQRYDKVAAGLAPAIAYLGVDGETAEWKDALGLRQAAFEPIMAGVADGGVQTVTRAKALADATDKLEKTTAPTATKVLGKIEREIAGALKPQRSAKQKSKLDDLQRVLTDLKAIQPPTTAVLARAVDLSQVLQSLSGLESVASDVPVILGADSALVFTVPDTTFQPAAGASLGELTEKLNVWDWIANLIALAGIASVGVLVLWVTNTTWGSVQDVLLALLAGAGTRLSIGKIGTSQH
ncbi:hypothetical protein CK230_21915 [Mesorhizobium sp. WSM3859]|nr:hypothetical protein CK230_21915 [Mesorhizobium sp. WSM3859]